MQVAVRLAEGTPRFADKEARKAAWEVLLQSRSCAKSYDSEKSEKIVRPT